MNNMAAPVLAALVISFFYTGLSALGVLFPEVFSHEVPKVTVCLAAMAVCITTNCAISIDTCLPAPCSYQWICHEWIPTGPNIWVHWLLENFHELLFHATHHQQGPKTCSEDEGTEGWVGSLRYISFTLDHFFTYMLIFTACQWRSQATLLHLTLISSPF